MIKKISKQVLMMTCALAIPYAAMADQPSVKIEAPDLHGSRPLEKQTESSVIRDYLQSWQSLRTALDQNAADALDPDFVGTAHDKLAQTIAEQVKAGIHTEYQDRSHDIQIVFYSPDGLSIQLIDNVAYDEQVLDRNGSLTLQHITARYVVVLTPAEVRWRVRIFQASAP
jgi:hypothetical protein